MLDPVKTGGVGQRAQRAALTDDVRKPSQEVQESFRDERLAIDAPSRSGTTALRRDFEPPAPRSSGLRHDHPQMALYETQAASRNCQVLQVVDQGNSQFDHPVISTPDGRCQSIVSVHAFSQLHNCPSIWSEYLEPTNRHLSFAMLQRGGEAAEKFESQALSQMLLHMAGPPKTWYDTFASMLEISPSLDREALDKFKNFADERVRLAQLSFVPGAAYVSSQSLGERLDIDKLIGELPAGVHLLKLTISTGQSHMLSCNISDRTDIPSRLMDPNACDWAGDEQNLGLLLKDHWQRNGLIDRWCKGGTWQRLTYRAGIEPE